MSVIAAKVYNDKVVVAADSILVKGWSKRNANFSKLACINNMIIGGTGTAQEMSMMWQYMKTHKPASPSEKDVLSFVIEFSEWKQKLTSNSSINNEYLLVYEGKLFEIEHMFVHEIKDYTAIGAGEDFSNAALFLCHSPREAVKVACELSCYVTEPIIQYEMEIKD